MGYSSRRGRRPQENASKSSHTYIINDPTVIDFLSKCDLPKEAKSVELAQHRIIKIEDVNVNPINHIIAIDGGYSEIPIKREFPSSTITFFQFGALIFNTSDLNEISQCPFIDPEDIEKLKKIQRLKLSVPTKNISFKEEKSLISSFRRTLYEFFKTEPEGDRLMETLKWFLFKEYDTTLSEWNLASCPNLDVDHHGVLIKRDKISKDYIVKCEHCGEDIYLTDVFRLHEAIDNEIGAGGVLGYLTTLVEQMILVHLIRLILKTKPSLMGEVLFIKDGPLAFFGQTANMYKPMRDLTNFLLEKHNLFLSGLEKSGAFVEHADEISNRLNPGDILLLDNDYIYRYIIPGTADPDKPYARTSYYGGKLIYKSRDDKVYVVTIPVKDENIVLNPKREDFQNIDVILNNLEKLKCDMYDSALIPVALVNKLVSLADHPSSVILEKFAKSGIK
jgi:hypothetical protein